MSAIEVAYERGWHRLWLGIDSSLVIQVFSNPQIVPWRLGNKWKSCLIITSTMQFKVSHIYREGSSCADKLASHGVLSKCFSWWDLVPDFIRIDFYHNRLGLPNFRFK